MITYFLAWRPPLVGHTPFASGLTFAEAAKILADSRHPLEILADVEPGDDVVAALRAEAAAAGDLDMVADIDAAPEDHDALNRVRRALAEAEGQS